MRPRGLLYPEMLLDVLCEDVTDFGVTWDCLLCAGAGVHLEIMPRARAGEVATGTLEFSDELLPSL